MRGSGFRRILAVTGTVIACLAVFAAVAFAATITGDDTGENIKGTTGDDTITAAGGDDKVNARQGTDVVTGDAGNDILFGGRGNDSQNGGDGNDKMHGGDGDDTQYGDAGDDTIYAGFGVDTSYGGDGNDRLWALARRDTRQAGVDTLDGGAGDDVFRTRDGEADNITCGDGTDTAYLDRKDVITDATEAAPNGSCETVKRHKPRRKWKDSGETGNEPAS